MAFRAEPAASRFYVGLARRPQTDEIDLELLTSLEPKVPGYKRAVLVTEDFSRDGRELVTKRFTFSNWDKLPWPPVDIGFVATSNDGSGILLGWFTLRVRRELMFQEELSDNLRFRF